MILKNQARLSTSLRRMLRAKTKGGAQILIFCMFIMLLLVVYFKALFDYQRMGITKDALDDALVTSMVSGCTINREEFASSGSAVIYRKVTPALGEKISIDFSGKVVIDDEPEDVINGPEIRSPYAGGGVDSFLQSSYDSFEKNIKKNLRLDDSMHSLIAGISGEVVVSEFTIYNKYYNLDEDRNQTDFKFVEYTYVRNSGTWSVIEHTPNTFPNVYSSLTHSNIQLTETSMSVKLSFNVVNSAFTQQMADQGIDESQTITPVTYTRVVDVKTGTVL